MLLTLLCAAVLLVSPQGQTGETLDDARKLVETKDFDGAKKILESLVAHDGSKAEYRYQLSRLLAGHYRDLDAAEEQMEKAVEMADGNAEYHFFMGSVYGAQAQAAGLLSKFSYAKKTKNQFERAVELQPDSIRYRNALFQYYIMAPGIVGGGTDKAKVQAQEVAKRDPFNGHLMLAQVAQKDDDLGGAEIEFKLAIAVKPDSWRPHHLLGYLYLQAKRPDDAIAQFQAYTRLAPKDPNSFDSLADGYLAKGDNDNALKSYLQALGVDPHFPSSLYGSGSCYDKKNMKAEALQQYREYIAENPKGQFTDKAKDRVEELSK